MRKFVKLEPPRLKGYACTLEGYKEYVESYHYYRTVVESFKTRWSEEVKQSSRAGKQKQILPVSPDDAAKARKRAKRRAKVARAKERKASAELAKKVKEAVAVQKITAANLKIAKALSAEKSVLGKETDDGWTTVVHKSMIKKLRPAAKNNTFRPGLGYVKQGATGYKAGDKVTPKPADKSRGTVTIKAGMVGTSSTASRPSKIVFAPRINAGLAKWKADVLEGYATFRTKPEYWLNRSNLQLSKLGVEELKEIDDHMIRCSDEYAAIHRPDSYDEYMKRVFFSQYDWFPVGRKPGLVIKKYTGPVYR